MTRQQQKTRRELLSDAAIVGGTGADGFGLGVLYSSNDAAEWRERRNETARKWRCNAFGVSCEPEKPSDTKGK